MRVRTALKLGLDRDIIANKVKGQGDLPAYGYTPPYTDGAKLSEPEWFTWSQEKRNEEAKKLLAEAGYSADKPLTFNLLYNTSDLHKKLAIAAASLWRKTGIDVKLVNQSGKRSSIPVIRAPMTWRVRAGAPTITSQPLS